MSGRHAFYAVTPVGFESVAAEELAELSAHDIRPGHGGVDFSGSLELMLRVNLRARCITRVMLRLDSFKALSFPELYNKARKHDWGRYLDPQAGFQVRASCHASRLLHSGRVEQAVSDAVRDRLGLNRKLAEAPDAGQTIHVRFDKDICTLSLDTSGERLDRRGYRKMPGAAPIRESLAAGLLRWVAWRPEEVLMVPMCGSGTIAIEAAWIAMRRPPGLRHAFPFLAWPVLKPKMWQSAKTKAEAMPRMLASVIHASDLDAAILRMARDNAAEAGVTGIHFAQTDMRELQPAAENGLLILNPPYGGRLGEGEAHRLYREIGESLRRSFGGWRKLVITPDASCEKLLGMRVRRRLPFRHGGLSVQALELEP